MQLSAKIAKLEKSNRKLKRATKKCKCDNDSDSDNSDASWSDGSGSTGIDNSCTKRNKTKYSVNIYPSPSKSTTKVDSRTHVRVLRSIKDSINLSIIDTLHQQDSKNLVAKIYKNTQSELTAELSDPELLGALLNSVSSAFKANKKEESLL